MAGRLTIDFQIDHYAATDNLYFSLQSSNNTDSSTVGPMFRVYNGVVGVYDGTNLITLSNLAAEGVRHSFQIDFDANSQTWSGTLDGSALALGPQTIFAFKTNVASISYFKLSFSGGSTWQSKAYVDNIKLVQTPAPVMTSPSITELNRIWNNRKQYFIDSIDSSFRIPDTYVLYNIEMYTVNLLRFAAATTNLTQLDGLAEVYLSAYKYLTYTNKYVYHYWPGYPTQSVHPLEAPAKMWLGAPLTNGVPGRLEGVLVGSQFLYAVAYLINTIVDLPEAQRTANMTNLVAQYTPVILTDHYHRWIFADQGIFQRKAYGAESGLYNHKEFLLKLLNREFGSTQLNPPSYFNFVTDTDMWILGGVVEMLAAHAKDPVLVPLVESERTNLLAYVELGAVLMTNRFSYSSLTNFQGSPVTGINFDLGSWDDYGDYKYAGYTGAVSPMYQGWPDMPGTNVGWDISHARRFVNFFETMYRNRDVTGLSFPDRSVMEGLSAQLIYGAGNKDINAPLFSNFMDGQNGWYRVAYHTNFPGYRPYGSCTAFLTGGYGFWGEFNSDLAKVRDILWKKIKSLYTADFSGNHRDGTVVGGQWTSGSAANGSPGFMTLAGNTNDVNADYINCGKEGYSSSAGTIEFWIKPTKTNTMEDIVNIFEDTYYNFLLIRRATNSAVQLCIEDNDVTKSSVISVGTIPVGAWSHVAIAQDGSAAKIYINGTNTAVTGTNSAYWTGHLSVAGMWVGKGHWYSFAGGLDDVRVYNRALTAAEIRQDMTGQSPVLSNMVARWEFDAPLNKADINLITNYYADTYSLADSLSLLMFLPVLVGTDDLDKDGLPDEWEARYYGGTTNVNPNTICSNGVNTVQEAYVAGYSPTDPSAFFAITQFDKNAGSPGSYALRWNKVDGRFYTVYWTSNLVSGFPSVPLADHITAGAFTDTAHSTNTAGFYRIEVGIAP
ncbi:MAG: LamG domain-containing protein [Verrucomicrobia bacterium]|nr:LamG domain-containing protein [Verrucomicrobiota bacterium]